MRMKKGSWSSFLKLWVALCTVLLVWTPIPKAQAAVTQAGVVQNININDSANAAAWSLQYSLQPGDKQYGDRATTITTLPDPYYGWQWFQAAASSKNYTGSTLLSFQVLVKAQIYVAWDSRKTLPSWLSGWYDTGDDMVNSDSVRFRVYKKDVSANTNVALGNTSGGDSYTVIVKDLSPIGWAGYDALGQNGTTGGAGGSIVTATNQQELEAYANSADPLTIRVQGTISMSPWGYKVKVKSNKTIIGLGTKAALVYGGLEVTNNEKNVIIRNLTIKDSFQSWDGKLGDWDAITVQNGAHHVWIDRCTLTHMEDGLMDVVKGGDYVTLSNTVLSNHNKTIGIGTDGYANRPRVTIHHNFFNGTNQRNPRVNRADVHVFNNYYLNIGDYGITSHNDADVLVEGNYFKDSEDVTQIDLATPGDIVFTSDNIKDNCTGANDTRGSVFNPADYYSYIKDSASTVPANVLKTAGAGKIRK
ncbi:polysaccharide lyase family 1 protein [Paenibacillus sp. 32352]|uniref:pectate lyase family protein n=1 Tax=Paenibacillus sp. 32352 TaxID=1969111 RepID=UPI0015C4741F|nr:hypothetical protein [Paenibacillus sp. 32352]